jgi:tellurite resistance protein TehA-like permease
MVFWITGVGTVGMVLLHKENYGQLFSNGVLMMMVGATLGGTAAGWMLDICRNYTVIFLWGFGFWALLAVPLILVYRLWKRHGGPRHYVAPSINEGFSPKRF